MKFYTCEGKYFTKQTDATKFAREEAKNSYSDIEVQRVSVALDRENVLRMLNVDGGHTVEEEIVYVTRGRLKGRLA